MKKSYQFLSFFLFLFPFSTLSAQSNQYLHLDQEDDYVEVPNASSYVANSNEITMAGWFYTDELVYGQGMLGIRGGGTGDGEMYIIQLANGILECRFKSGNTLYEYVAPAFTIVPQVWQHVAWVYDGSAISLYIDGVLKGSSPASGVIATTNTPFTIGRSILSTLNFYYGGRVDEVTLWSKALDATAIQDMMANELTGSESGLELYYKCNQGAPGEDNTSISTLNSEIDNSNRAGILQNFAMMGNTSNFDGFLDPTFQAITFPTVPNKLTTDQPFELMAESSAGLPITYEVLSGSATVTGNTVTLAGTQGQVKIRATQDGDATYDPAVPIEVGFEVIDPMQNVARIDARSPLAGDVYVPTLKPIQLAAISNITFPELFEVTDVRFTIGSDEVAAKDWGNEHYTAWWMPPAYGNYSMTITATNNYGAEAISVVSFDVVDQVSDVSAVAFTDAWVSVDQSTVEMDGALPSYLGAFDEITGLLAITCPTGGCDPWDRASSIEAKGHNGEWIEIIRYVTPYGVACNSEIDLTDFMSILQGKIRFRVHLVTFENGFEYSLDLDYKAGTPAHPYSTVSEVWRNTYDFGNMANLQPVGDVNVNYNTNTVESTLKLVSTGHGWGDNNTGNAAEFHEDTHHIWVNGTETFEQHNWLVCNPNPDACSPQNGTWFHNRAGWCPGAIAPWFDFNMTNYVGASTATLGYVFDEDYVDFCSPNNPNCTAFTCMNCDDGFNPHLIVSAYLVSKGDAPLEGTEVTGLNDKNRGFSLQFTAYPNPTTDKIFFDFQDFTPDSDVRIVNQLGQEVRRAQLALDNSLSLKDLPKGVYSLFVNVGEKVGFTKVILE